MRYRNQPPPSSLGMINSRNICIEEMEGVKKKVLNGKSRLERHVSLLKIKLSGGYKRSRLFR